MKLKADVKLNVAKMMISLFDRVENNVRKGEFDNRRSLVRSPVWAIFLLRIDDSHCDRIHSSLTAVRCFDNGYLGKKASGLERILYGVPIKRTPGKHG